MSWRIGQLSIEVDADGGLATIEPTTNSKRQSTATRTRDIAWPGDELRETVRFDDRGRYRPLSGAKTLPGGWRVRCSACDVDDVIDAVYPLATVHRESWKRGELRVVALDEVLERQSGRYAVAATLGDEGRHLARDVVCGDCVRAPVWSGEPVDEGAIPCPEPCSVLVSLCREAALWQNETPPGAQIDESVAYAAFERPGNALRESYLSKLREVRAASEQDGS